MKDGPSNSECLLTRLDHTNITQKIKQQLQFTPTFSILNPVFLSKNMNKNAFLQHKFSAALLFTLLIFSGCQTNLSGNDLSGNLGQVLDNNLTPEQQKIAALEEQTANLGKRFGT
jgi:hypothetical protein